MIKHSMTFKGRYVKSVHGSKEKRTYDHNYDCMGNVNKMMTAFDWAHRGQRMSFSGRKDVQIFQNVLT